MTNMSAHQEMALRIFLFELKINRMNKSCTQEVIEYMVKWSANIAKQLVDACNTGEI